TSLTGREAGAQPEAAAQQNGNRGGQRVPTGRETTALSGRWDRQCRRPQGGPGVGHLGAEERVQQPVQVCWSLTGLAELCWGLLAETHGIVTTFRAISR